ncbi:MAG TPA: threonine-phosphate decarboxylase CobD [Coleofasciculaceae cyanobacterium]
MNQPSHRPIHGGNLEWAARLAGCAPSEVLDFSASINPLGPPASALATIQAHLAGLKAYPDPEYRQLRSALAAFHQIHPDWILPGNGAAELLTWASRDLAHLDRTVLLTPAFGDYRRALQAFGAKLEESLVMDQWQQPETGALVNSPTRSSLGYGYSKATLQLTNPYTSNTGILINSPHNPTGLMFSRQSLLPYLDQFAVVVVDEAFMDFLPPDQQQSLIDWVGDYPNLVVIRSLTKFYSLPGLRLGYAIAHPDRLQRWQQWRDPWSVNTLAAAVGAIIIQDREFQQQTWDWLAAVKSSLIEGLQALAGLTPYRGAANFLLVRCQQSVTQLQADLLQRDRILIRDCLSFPELGDGYFRIAIRTAAENQRLLDALAQNLINLRP